MKSVYNISVVEQKHVATNRIDGFSLLKISLNDC